MDKCTPELQLPGFRFHPTEEELLDFYLRKMVFGKKLRADIIGFLDIYLHDPCELPGLAKNGEREWYFFVPRSTKQGNGGRPNRTTKNGFWKATGSDRKIRSLNNPKRVIGLKKTLVFYKGRAPRGCKTDWVMNEYRMPEQCTLPKEEIVVCKIYRKATSLKVLEQRAVVMEEGMKTSKVASPSSSVDTVSLVEQRSVAMEEEMKPSKVTSPSSSVDTVSLVEQRSVVMEEEMKPSKLASPSSSLDTVSLVEQDNIMNLAPMVNESVIKTEEPFKQTDEESKEVSSSARSLLRHNNNFPELQLPITGADWRLDPVWSQLHSPWLDVWTPYANVLYF